jgi:DNA-binding CsgD family transcriptional regulator
MALAKTEHRRHGDVKRTTRPAAQRPPLATFDRKANRSTNYLSTEASAPTVDTAPMSRRRPCPTDDPARRAASLLRAPDGLSTFRFRLETEEFVVVTFEAPPLEPAEPDLMCALTPTEREVAELAMDGRRDLEIARLRGVSVRTVGNQLAAIYRKLHVHSRRELIARRIVARTDLP